MKRVLPVRIPVYLQAELISKDKSYDAVIGNLSHEGAFVETGPTKTVTPFVPGKLLDMKFKVSSRNTMKLNCEIIWLYTKNTPPSGLTNSLGIKIIAPPSKYMKYFNTL